MIAPRRPHGLRVVMFYHSLISDWNHGNAHFLRGVVRELMSRGHDVRVYEPRNGWSLTNLRKEPGGEAALRAFRGAYPGLKSTFYDPERIDLDLALADADLVLVHEWNDHDLVARIGRHRLRCGDYRLLFHDTHHRSASDPASMGAYDLRAYDGVLAFGRVIRDLYLKRGWTKRAWTWHEAADARVYRPNPKAKLEGDLVWIGNWGDDERTAELMDYLIWPVKKLGLKAKVHGVRYPEDAKRALAKAGIEYGGWLPAARVPEVLSKFKTTVHVPRRPYVERLPGVPTIRVFEALACGVPLVCSPWEDSEGLFAPGRDYLVARRRRDMKRALRDLTRSSARRRELAAHGRATVLRRHTCAHRVEELMDICRELGLDARPVRGRGRSEPTVARPRGAVHA